MKTRIFMTTLYGFSVFVEFLSKKCNFTELSTKLKIYTFVKTQNICL